MKFKTLLFILFSIWFCDYLTTFIGIIFLGAIETNPFADYFYSSWYGWIIFPVIVFFGISLFSLIVVKLEKFAFRFEQDRIKISHLIPLSPIVTISILEGYTIINNLRILRILVG